MSLRRRAPLTGTRGFVIVPLVVDGEVTPRGFFDLVLKARRSRPGNLVTVSVSANVDGVDRRIRMRGELFTAGGLPLFLRTLRAMIAPREDEVGSASLISNGPVPTTPNFNLFELWFSATDVQNMNNSFDNARPAVRVPRLRLTRPGGLNPGLGAKPQYVKKGIPWLIQAQDSSHNPLSFVDDGKCLERVISGLGLVGAPPPHSSIKEQLEWLTQAVLAKFGKPIAWVFPYKNFDETELDPSYSAEEWYRSEYKNRLFEPRHPGCLAKYVFPFEINQLYPLDPENIPVIFDGDSHVALPVIRECEDGYSRFLPTPQFFKCGDNFYYISPKDTVSGIHPPWVEGEPDENGCTISVLSDAWTIRPAYLFESEKRRLARKDPEKTTLGHLFFDFETIVTEEGKVQPYAVSWLIVEVDSETFLPISPASPDEFLAQTHFYYGEDAAFQLLRQIVGAKSGQQGRKEFRKLVGVTFNGSNFDNSLLYEAFQTYMLHDVEPVISAGGQFKITDPKVQGTSLCNFRVDGYFTLFDLRRHLGGSLAKNCKDFKNTIQKVGDFNHEAVQMVFSERGFEGLRDYVGEHLLPDGKGPEDYPDKNYPPFYEHLEKYTKADTAALAELYYSYRKVNLFPDLVPLLEPKMTLASETFAAWTNFIKTEVAPSRLKEGEVVSKENVYQLWERMPVELIKELRDTSVVAGRVQLFHTPKWYKERCVSMDVKSLYPYVMCVKDVYYPCGSHQHYKTAEIAKEQYERSVSAGKLGLFKVTVDQSNLKRKDLPVILAAKTYKEDFEFYKREGIPLPIAERNNWHADVVNELWITSEEMRVLTKYHCRITVHEAVIWQDKIKSIELFGNLAHLMKVKNTEDRVKSAGGAFNAAKRTAAKLASNALFGKMLEGFHESSMESVTAERYEEIRADVLSGVGKYEYISAVYPFGKDVFAQTCKKVNDENFATRQRPVVIGFYILAYARMYMYEYAYSLLGRQNCYYTDTDAIKTSWSAFESKLLPVWRNTKIPHWPEAEEMEPLYKTDHIYEKECRCYGGFEDEFDEKPNGGIVTIAKKSWLKVPAGVTDLAVLKEFYLTHPIHEEADDSGEVYEYASLPPSDCKVGLKGVGKNDILLTRKENDWLESVSGDFPTWHRACASLFKNKERTVEKRFGELFARLLYGVNKAYVLRSTFLRHMTQLRRGVVYGDEERYVDKFAQMSHAYSVVTLDPKKNQEVTI